MCERNWLAPSSFGATRDRVEPDASFCSRDARLRDLERPLACSPIPAAAKARCLAPPREADPGMFLTSSSQIFGKVFDLQYRVSFALVLSHLVLSKLSVFCAFSSIQCPTCSQYIVLCSRSKNATYEVVNSQKSAPRRQDHCSGPAPATVIRESRQPRFEHNKHTTHSELKLIINFSSDEQLMKCVVYLENSGN